MLDDRDLDFIKNKKLLLSISGGVDSMVMLYLIYNKMNDLNLDIEVFHQNHKTRNGDSDLDARFVEDVCKKLNLKYYIAEESMDNFAKENSISKEEAGRILRKKNINRILINNGADFVLLAHNLDDQVETILMRIIRGSGVDGLSGMAQIDGNIFRPLLGCKKNEILKFAEQNNIEFRQDLSNFKNDFTRNSIRNELIPIIKEKYNPNFENSLIKLSDISKGYKIFILEHILNFRDKIIKEDSQVIKYQVNDLINVSDFQIIELLKNDILKLKGDIYNFQYSHFSEILKIIHSKNSGSVIINDMIFYCYSKFFCIRKYKKMDDDILVKEKGSYRFNGYSIIVKDFKGEFLIRSRKNGDKINFGNKNLKLKDFFINKKFDIVERDKIPVIEEKGVIIQVGNLYKQNDNIEIIRRIDE